MENEQNETNGNQEPKKIKTRDLPMEDYLDILQLEYFVCELRSKIYFSPKDKKYWKFQMERKKEKIEGISARLQTTANIFQDRTVYENYKKKIYPIDFTGLPNFDINEKYQLNNDDIRNYYLEQQVVFVLERDAQGVSQKKFGKIHKAEIHNNRIEVEMLHKSEKKTFSLKEVTRVLE